MEEDEDSRLKVAMNMLRMNDTGYDMFDGKMMMILRLVVIVMTVMMRMLLLIIRMVVVMSQCHKQPNTLHIRHGWTRSRLPKKPAK